MAKLRVVVVSEDPLTRTGLVNVLSGRSDLVVAAHHATLEGALAAPAARPPDVLVWDMDARAQEDAALAGIPCVVIVRDEERGIEALRRGARAVLFRDADAETLAAAVAAAARGLTVLDETVSEAVLRTRVEAAARPLEPLTPRETEVLNLLAQGFTNKMIAQALAISEHTAKFHVNAILGKLGAQSRTEAIVQAARRGLVVL